MIQATRCGGGVACQRDNYVVRHTIFIFIHHTALTVNLKLFAHNFTFIFQSIRPMHLCLLVMRLYYWRAFYLQFVIVSTDDGYISININIQGAANKSNPLQCFVNISTPNRNFYKKIYMTIYRSYLYVQLPNYIKLAQHLTKLCPFNRGNPTFCEL